MQFYLIGALIFLTTMLIFVFQNQQLVKIKFITWVSPEISLALVVLMAACFGALITFLVERFRSIKKMQLFRQKSVGGKNQPQESARTKGSAGA